MTLRMMALKLLLAVPSLPHEDAGRIYFTLTRMREGHCVERASAQYWEWANGVGRGYVKSRMRFHLKAFLHDNDYFGVKKKHRIPREENVEDAYRVWEAMA